MYTTEAYSYSPRFFPNTLIEKHIEEHQLTPLLKDWVSHGSKEESRERASSDIFSFYTKEIHFSTANQPKNLTLSQYKLRFLPNILFSTLPFTGLVELNLSLNRLQELPLMDRLQNLQSINLHKNSFERFPDTLCSCRNLRHVELSHNRLYELPDSFANLKKVSQLNLSYNQFKEFPPCIRHLKNLEELHMENNKLTELSNLSLPPQLQTLNINDNLLKEFPGEIFKLSELRFLLAGNNRLLSLPHQLNNLTKLHTLYFSGNPVCEFPSQKILSSLKHLFISSVYLTHIPDFITRCSSLTELSLTDNTITKIPDSISHLTNLKKLLLDFNKLHCLPATLCELKKMKSINLEGNDFTEFPEVVVNMPYLERVNLNFNELIELPSSCFRNVPNSLEIAVEGNPFPEEEVQRVQNIIYSENYKGPIITGLPIQPIREKSIAGFYKVFFESSQQTPKKFVNLPNDSPVLLSWLTRLGSLEEFIIGKNKKPLSTKILAILETANENPLFREVFFKVIEEASETCGDRVALSFIHLDIRYQLETADLTQVQEVSSFLLRGVFAIDILGKYALQKIKSKKTVDDIELYLAYPIRLKKDLNLPFTQNYMCYFEFSQLTPADLQEAKDRVLSYLQNQQECISFLIDNETWKKVLSLNYPKEWKRVQNNKQLEMEGEVDYSIHVDIGERYKEELRKLTEKALYYPETLEEQFLEDPLDVLLNCVEKSQFNVKVGSECLVNQRENLLTTIFFHSETKEQILLHLEALLSTLCFFHQQTPLEDIELLSFLLPLSSPPHEVPSISSCIHEILPRASGRLYVELLQKLCKQREIKKEILKGFFIKEKNPFHRQAKSVNLLSRLTTSNINFQLPPKQSTETQSMFLCSLFFLLQSMKKLFTYDNQDSPSKKFKGEQSQEIHWLLSHFEKIAKIMGSSLTLLPTKETAFSYKEVIKLITDCKTDLNAKERVRGLPPRDLSTKEKDYSSKFTFLRDKFKNLRAQKNSVDTVPLSSTTRFSENIHSIPKPRVVLSPSLEGSSTVTETALSRLPPLSDTQGRERERRGTGRVIKMARRTGPVYYKKA